MTKIEGDWPGRTAFQWCDELILKYTHERDEWAVQKKFLDAYHEVSTGVGRISVEIQLRKLNGDIDNHSRAIVALGKIKVLFVGKKREWEQALAKAQPGSLQWQRCRENLIKIGDPT